MADADGKHADTSLTDTTRSKRRLTRMSRKTDSLDVQPKSKILACQICVYVARHHAALDYHMKKVHGKGEMYTCSVCKYTCIDKKHLTQHFRQHTGEKPFTCEFCGDYRSKSAAGLRYHVRTKHDKSSLISCPTCEYKAYNTYILTQHLRKHSGIKPFICKDCGQQFSFKASLRHHMLSKHPTPGDQDNPAPRNQDNPVPEQPHQENPTSSLEQPQGHDSPAMALDQAPPTLADKLLEAMNKPNQQDYLPIGCSLDSLNSVNSVDSL